MGNEQSSENTRKPNYKICKIIGRVEYSGSFRCYLDDYIPYSDGNYKRMDFEKIPTALEVGAFLFGNSGDRPNLHKGHYIAIDIDRTRNHISIHNFSSRSVEEVGMEIIDSNGKLTFVEFFGGIAEAINEARERRATAAEWASFDKSMQEAWQLQPPKK